jgi:hypothetical protein
MKRLGLRWTIGDVSREGFEALGFSIRGAWKIFNTDASYAVCVNTIPITQARELVGEVLADVEWHAVTFDDLPDFLKPHLDGGMSEGVGWKFAPLRLFPEHYELALDNDCILWEMPEAIGLWLGDSHDGRCVIAEDVKTCFGQFEKFCGPEPRNSGIRGLPPGFDLEQAMKTVLRQHPVALRSELDEQGLQCAAVSLQQPAFGVKVDEVTICSPFPPHLKYLGKCGAHFVGLNAKQLPWESAGRPASDLTREHWLYHRDVVCQKVSS